jgi:MFS family permease
MSGSRGKPRPEGGRETLDLRLMIPLLVVVLAFQGTMPLARIGTTYTAIEAGLSVSVISFISAGFAILPVFLTVFIGKLNDRGNYGIMSVVGALLLAGSVMGLLFLPPTTASLFLCSATLGFGHTVMLNSTQMFVSRFSTETRDRVLGQYMIATSLGQILGPLGISLTVDPENLNPGEPILILCLVGAFVLLVGVLILMPFAKKAKRSEASETITIASILRTSQLRWIMLASNLCLAASDLLLVFLPILAVERGIPATAIGTILAVRAAVTLASRFVFVQLIAALGRLNLLVVSMCVTAAGFALLALPLDIWTLTLVVAICGLGIGLALPTSLSLTFAMAPPQAIGTVTSVRLTMSRLSQFIIPMSAGALAAVTGTWVIFATVSATMSIAALFAWRRI